MEFKSVIYNAARDGKLQRLKIFLENRNKEEKGQLVNAKTNGATPLIIACRNGHLPVVEYLLEYCRVGLDQVGQVTFDGEVIEGAPALWCAAAAGFINIVKYLSKMGSKVNETTYTNSTPLRAACFDGHFDIVKFLVENDANIEIANRHGHTCLMIACYKGHLKIVKYLLERGADVNRKSLKGNTALHDCAESGSLEIMKVLLEKGAKMDKDSYGMTPLLAAAVTGHAKIVEYLITCKECTKSDRIDALELLGATYVDKKRDMMGGLEYWKLALKERYCDSKNVIRKPADSSPIAAYENAREVQTISELEDASSEPDDMRMQALLVRERILGPAHPDTSYYIRYRGAVYADMGNFDRCIMLWMYALDMQQKMLEPLNPMTQSSLLSFAELFSFMTSVSSLKQSQPHFKDMLKVLLQAVQELETGMTEIAKTPASERDSSNFNRLLVIIMHLICLMCNQKEKCSEDEQHEFKKTVYRLIRMNPRGAKGFTPLHLSCSKDTSSVGRYPVCSFPSKAVASLLLEVGASVNAVDLDNNTPLHIACMNKPIKSEVIQLLLDNGAHIDTCNLDHKTPMQVMRNLTIYDVVSPLNYMTLQCIAARCIIANNIPYKGHVPIRLESFIRMH